MEHILGPHSHVPLASLLRLLLGMTMEIWERGCGPLRPIFFFFCHLGPGWECHISMGQETWREGSAILVADDQGSIALEFCICSSRPARVMQLTVRATLPNFASFAVFCPDVRPSARGTAGSQRDSKPNPDARDQGGYPIR